MILKGNIASKFRFSSTIAGFIHNFNVTFGLFLSYRHTDSRAKLMRDFQQPVIFQTQEYIHLINESTLQGC